MRLPTFSCQIIDSKGFIRNCLSRKDLYRLFSRHFQSSPEERKGRIYQSVLSDVSDWQLTYGCWQLFSKNASAVRTTAWASHPNFSLGREGRLDNKIRYGQLTKVTSSSRIGTQLLAPQAQSRLARREVEAPPFYSNVHLWSLILVDMACPALAKTGLERGTPIESYFTI